MTHARSLDDQQEITIDRDGHRHSGTYFVADGIVYVQCFAGSRATQMGRSTPAQIARLLLSELVAELTH